jgi:hypothetical protein
MPVIDNPEEPSQFGVFRTTLAPIFQGRGEYGSSPLQWGQREFVERLRRLFAEVLPEPPPLGFDYGASVTESGDHTVTLTWQKDANATFTGTGKTEDLAFLDAAARAYAHPHFRRLLDQDHVP